MNINLTKNQIYLQKKNIIFLISFIFIITLFTLLVNNYFFKDKVSLLRKTKDQIILYPSQNPISQGFTAPNSKIAGFTFLMSKDSNDISSNITITLLDSNQNNLCDWEISANDVTDKPVYLSLEDVSLVKNSQYYLVAWTQTNSTIGIEASTNASNGYKSTVTDGYTWCYQIIYNGSSPFIIILEIICIVSMCLFYIALQYNVKETTLLSIAYIILALLYFAITPINMTWDEDGHFMRSYEISTGHLVSDHFENGLGKSSVPSIYPSIFKYLAMSASNEKANFLYDKQTDTFDLLIDGSMSEEKNYNQALYSPASYIPQSIGLFTASHISDNVGFIYFYGRFFALLFNTTLILFSIHLLPDHRHMIFLLSSNPVFLNQAISYSADGTLNALSIFYIAYIIHISQKSNISIADKLIILLSSMIISLSKVIYFPLSFLVFLLPNNIFKNNKQSIIYKLTNCVLSISGFIIWYQIAMTYLIDRQMGKNVQPHAQIQYILTHIYLAPVIAIKTTIYRFGGWFKELFGSYLGGGYFHYHNIIWIVFAVIIIFEMIHINPYTDVSYKLTTRNKILISFIIFIIITLTYGSLYVQWTEYKADIIDGIQGRYFIPLLLPLTMILKRIRIIIPKKNKLLIMLMVVFSITIFVLANIYQLYV